MMPVFGKLPCASACVTSGIAFAALALGMALSSPAAAATKEISLATAAQGLAFCQSGKMTAADAYINGGPGLVQEPPTACTQAVVKKVKVSLAIEADGRKVKECKLANATAAMAFCQSGSMGTYNIDYISGKVGYTISGPGYGCTLGFSTSSIGTALCK